MIPETKRSYTINGNKVYFAEGWQEKLAEAGLTPECDWTTLEVGELISASKRVSVFKYRLKCGTLLYFKRYVYDSYRKEFFLRPGKAINEVHGYAQLKKIGVPTLKTVAYGEQRKWGTLYGTFIATIGIENSTSLDDYAFDVWHKKRPSEKRRIYELLSKQIIEQLRLAHEHSFFHLDLKWRNILVVENAGELTTVWIDCPRSKYMRLRHKRGVMVELTALSRLALSYLTKSQRLKFLKDYLGDPTKEEWKSLWREVNEYLSKRMPKPVDFSGKE